MPPRAIINATAPNNERQLRRRDGIPRKTRKARTAPPPAPNHPLALGCRAGLVSWLVVGAVVEIVAVTVPVVLLDDKVTEEGEREQVGASTALEGEVVTAQVSVAVPA
jgi:hypothetical protein